uniref:Globin n=1 Tax=Ciona intestinalis TaxID=7719 RepID=Q70T64_CIOIN|nr:globin [Ciona intestinalis]
MPFTDEELKLLRDSWDEVKKLGMKEVGLHIFTGLLNAAPSLRTLFYTIDLPDEEELTIDVMRENKKVVAHATRIANAISKFIKFLDQPDELEKLLTSLGESHARRQVDPESFEYVAPVILSVIGGHLKLPSNSPTLQAWVKAYGVLRNGIVSAMEA